VSVTEKSVTTDRDYLRIVTDGSITLDASGTPDSDSGLYVEVPPTPTYANSTTITHGLSSTPLVRAYWDPLKNGVWWSSNPYRINSAYNVPWLKTVCSSTTVKLIMNSDTTTKTAIPVYYRIYDLGTSSSITSDYKTDKIFAKSSTYGTTAAAASSFDSDYKETTITIPHGQSEVPLFTIQHSVDQASWYSEASRIIGAFDTTTGPPGGPYANYYFTTAFAYADSTNLYIVLQSNYPSIQTIYVRYILDAKT